MSDLKPCPFCGCSENTEDDIREYTNGTYSIVCRGCLAENAFWMSKKDAMDGWNTRPLEDAMEAEIDCLNKYADKLIDALPGDYLPKDIEVIRKANVRLHDLEAENQRLREAVENARSLLIISDLHDYRYVDLALTTLENALRAPDNGHDTGNEEDRSHDT